MAIKDIFNFSKAPVPTDNSVAPANPDPTKDITGDKPVSTPTPDPTKPVSPLDGFSDLWQTVKVEDGENDTDLSSIIKIDQAKIAEAMNNISFSQVIGQEDLAKISEGGEAAQTAFVSALDKVSKAVFSQSMVANATLIQQAITQAGDKIDKRTSNALRNNQIKDSVRGINPILNHPSFAPIASALESQLAAKYPTASPEDIKTKAAEYLNSFASELTKDTTKVADADKGFNWDKYLEL